MGVVSGQLGPHQATGAAACAIEQAKAAVGVLDELQLSQVPVLLGGGRRLFDVLPAQIELEVVRVIDTPEATHLRYRVLSPAASA